MIQQRVTKYIEKEHLFSPDDKILIALSGGADSVALDVYKRQALGYQSGKAVAYCTLSPDQPYDAIEKADSYTLKLYAPNQTTPSAVIECKKMPSQTTPQAGQPRTYVGEIVKLLMKK